MFSLFENMILFTYSFTKKCELSEMIKIRMRKFSKLEFHPKKKLFCEITRNAPKSFHSDVNTNFLIRKNNIKF